MLPRQSCIERKAVGKSGQVQLIATNIDFGLIVQAVDRDFNLNRLERYLTICNASGVQPIIVLSKIDLISAADVDTSSNYGEGQNVLPAGFFGCGKINPYQWSFR